MGIPKSTLRSTFPRGAWAAPPPILGDMNDANNLSPRHRHRRLLSMSMVLAVMLFAGCGSTSRTSSEVSARAGAHAAPAGPAIPDTPAGRQARWLLIASSRLPIPATELNQH